MDEKEDKKKAKVKKKDASNTKIKRKEVRKKEEMNYYEDKKNKAGKRMKH